ncbi:hypothetical protein AAAC51_41285 [Priestia megaterium]
MPAEQQQVNSEVAASVSYVNESKSTSTSFSKASTTTSKVDAIDLLLQSPKDRSKESIEVFTLMMMC